MKAKLVKEGLDMLAASSKWDAIKRLDWNLEEYGVRYMEVNPDEIRTLYVSNESDLLPEADPAVLAFGYSEDYGPDEPPWRRPRRPPRQRRFADVNELSQSLLANSKLVMLKFPNQPLKLSGKFSLSS